MQSAFNKLKDRATSAVAQVKQTVEAKKNEYEQAQRAKWMAEVRDEKDATRFKVFEGWRDVYEPVKRDEGGAEKKEKAEDPGIVMRTVLQKVGDSIRGNIMKTMAEVLSRLLGPADHALRAKEPTLSAFLNATNAVSLTYRFEYKGKKKMKFIRGKAAEGMAVALVEAINKEGALLGHETEMDPAVVREIAAGIAKKLQDELQARQALAVAFVKNAPLFKATGADDAQVDAGVAALTLFLKNYLESKVGVIMQAITITVDKLLALAAKHRAAINAHIAARLKNPEADDSEEFARVTEEVLGEIESKYVELDTAVGGYVNALIAVLAGISDSAPAAPAE